MLKKLQFVFLFLLLSSVGILAQQVMLTDEFDNGDGKWTSGWIDAASATVTTSIDNASKLSGANSYKLVITKGSADTWRVQRNADLPLLAGYQYTVSFMAVASKNASINVLFELAGDPYTKRLNETPQVTTTAQTFTYKMISEADVPTNQLKLHFGGTSNDGATIWVDKIIVTRVADPSLITQWGSTPRGTANWPVLNTAATPAGSASIGADAKPTGWTSIKGGFTALTPTTSQAFVITGTFEFVGGGAGNAYTWLRFALFNGDGVLNNPNTPTAAWTEDGNGNGYIFTPVTGTGTVSNTYNTWPTGNQGTNWPLINSKSWTSTNSNGGGPFATVMQQPARQVAVTGVYDWAISVQPLAAGGNEIRWYFVQRHAANSQNYYWWGGTFKDPTPVTTKFNSIGFACNNDLDATTKQVNLSNVKASLGSPITVPAAPFSALYVDKWGTTPRGSSGWTIKNDSTYIVGDAAMGGTAAPTGWMSIKGGFNTVDITQYAGKALVISGTFEFVGGGAGNAYTWLRYALFNGDGVLNNQNKPTAAWTEDGNGNGYIFTPVSGTGTISNTYNTWPTGNQGTNWSLINSKSWTSTNSNGGGPYSTILQKPARQVAVVGVYDWAISVQRLADGTNEVRWYFVQKHAAGIQNYYWWGGSFIDATPLTSKINSIGFACNNDLDATTKQVNIRNVKVDIGNPINIPKAPWQAYYVDKWGFYGGRIANWKFTPGDVVGNATISGTTQLPADQWTMVRAGFLEPISGVNKDTALVVTGKMEFVGGGFEAPNSLLFGLNYTESAGKVVSTKVDSTRWDGTDNRNFGYLFIPPSGKNAPLDWILGSSYKSSNLGAVVNRPWESVNGDNNYAFGVINQKPANAIGGAGVYDFLISVAPQTDGTNEVKFKVNNANSSYVWSGRVIDNNKPLATQKFNAITFAYGGGSKATALKLTDLKLDLINPATILVSVESREGLTSSIPTEFVLDQNYPNPFNPITTIQFALPQTGKVKLVVYDVLGRVVNTLVDGELNAGYHKINFNASNLASGIYMYSLTSGDFVSVKKLVLLK